MTARVSLRPSAVKTEFVLDAVAQGNMQIDPERAESPRFSGRCIAALAADAKLMEKSGGIYSVKALASEYAVVDPDKE